VPTSLRPPPPCNTVNTVEFEADAEMVPPSAPEAPYSAGEADHLVAGKTAEVGGDSAQPSAPDDGIEAVRKIEARCEPPMPPGEMRYARPGITPPRWGQSTPRTKLAAAIAVVVIVGGVAAYGLLRRK
jgi:hypothetical protein